MKLRHLLTVLGIVLLAVINLTPLIWGALTSIKPSPDIMTYPPKVWGFTPTLEHYRLILDSDFPMALRNTSFYAMGSVVLGVFLASLAAYGFDRFRFRSARACSCWWWPVSRSPSARRR
jgi:ABC-type glycerol-3-phosphate transport system permease component